MIDLRALNLATGLYRHASASPGRVALVVDEVPYTYGELGDTAGRVAYWLRARACRDDRPARVGILANRSYETYAGILGALWAGATYVPLSVKQPAARLGAIIARAGVDALVVDKRGGAHLGELAGALPAHVLVSDQVAEDVRGQGLTAWNAVARGEKMASPVEVRPDDPAYVMFTSGTTGVPKGVAISAGNVAHYLGVIHDLYGISPEDRLAQFSETTFDISVFDMFSAWQGGAAIHPLPESKLMSPGDFIRSHALTIWASVPSVILMLRRMKQLAPGSLPSIRATFFGGEGLGAGAAQAWREAAINGVLDNHYGPTEATVAVSRLRVTDTPVETEGRGTLSIGKAYAGTQIDVVGEGGAFVGDGEVGELALWGPQLGLGYLDDPALTAKRFPTLSHPQLGESRWYLTGDFGYRDEQGYLHCLGRIDNQVKVMGYRVELEEVEAHLRAVCGSDAVAAVAWPVVDGHAAGLVGFMAGAKLLPAAVREGVRQRVPAYMVPRTIVDMDALPLSANGKVDRKALCAHLDQRGSHAGG